VPSAATSVTTDPYAVPPKITAAYVQRVLNALEGVNGAIAREVVSTRTFNNSAAVMLRAITTPDEFSREANLWATEVGGGLNNFVDNPGAVHDSVSSLLSAQSACVFVSVYRNFSAVARTPPPNHLSFIQLVPKAAGNDPQRINPTPWAFGFVGFSNTGGSPGDPCVG
jgi:hypothetical protein